MFAMFKRRVNQPLGGWNYDYRAHRHASLWFAQMGRVFCDLADERAQIKPPRECISIFMERMRTSIREHFTRPPGVKLTLIERWQRRDAYLGMRLVARRGGVYRKDEDHGQDKHDD